MTVAGWRCACGADDLHTVYCPSCGRPVPGWVPLSSPDDTARGRFALDRRGRWTAAALLLVLAAGLNVLTVRVTDRNTAVRRARAAALQRTVAELEAFVADHHGGPFLRPVSVKALGDADFLLALGGVDPDDPPQPSSPTKSPPPASGDFASTMKGLGIADVSDDPDRVRATLLTDGIQGFYSTGNQRLYVRSRQLTAYARLVLVHELTHAWQDQHYDLDSVLAGITGTDRVRATRALIEGDAARVERAWRESRGAERAEIDAYERTLAKHGEPSRAERAYDALLAFPYQAGEAFVRTVLARGGNAALDAAFAAPPVSTEQVLHPAAYFRHDTPTTVPTPSSDDEVADVDAGELGEVGLIVVVGQGRIDRAALLAASGWDGDAYVTWRLGATTCTRVALVMDTGAGRDRLLGVLRTQHVAGRTVDGTGPTSMLMTTCVATP
ncbi:MAG: hypothetical protein QOE45_1387 [Frankiaceae bacterium]|nr:hypothetical protein [Frankiaceae bacterium]